MLNIILFVISLIKAEGYYCPYSDLGFVDNKDLLYDYYTSVNDYYVRQGTIGWETRNEYCNAKGDSSIHNDAGQAKCEDSQGVCLWSGSSCDVNTNKQADCYNLCKTIVNGGGLSCLGNCPGGNVDRSQIYSICNNVLTITKTESLIFTTTMSCTFETSSFNSCNWVGHCNGDTCNNDDDCSDDLTCKSGLCG